MDLKHHLNVLDQMSNQLMSQARSSTNDRAEFNATRDTFFHAIESAQQRKQTLKENIRELLSVEENVLAQLDDLRSQTTQLLSELAAVEENKSELEKEIECLTSNIKYKKEQESLLNDKFASSTNTMKDFPEFINVYNLYSNLSNVRWDHSTPEDTVKGFVLRPDKKEVIPFKLVKKSHTKFFITNFLWEQIGADNDFL
ncbi:hypothetical protein Pcinc_008409 [Petrolisthes cinctipes]|uniref:Kinetochore protein Spc24 n=1 Tax=Petrolisthes cinctipes TaxID=88211 RepID=A0AAE1KXK1_PETCI|nr:hypothetical protein Pcinc_008409 [Petrolisthes cinctipes]